MARATPGRAKAARIASRLSGASLRRGRLARLSGGSDSATPKYTQARLIRLRPAATRQGTAPWRPAMGIFGQRAADPGAQDEAQPEGHADEPHAFGALLGAGDVGDVRAGGAEVRGGDAAEDARREEPRDAAPPGQRETQAGHGQGRAGDGPEQHRTPPDAVGDAPPDRDEEKLHQRVDRPQQGGDERADPEGVARLLGQEGQHQPEAEQIDEDGEEDGAEPRCRFHGLRATIPIARDDVRRSRGAGARVDECLAVSLGSREDAVAPAEDVEPGGQDGLERRRRWRRRGRPRRAPRPCSATLRARPTSNCGLIRATRWPPAPRAARPRRGGAWRGR